MGGLCRLDRRVDEISATKRYSSALNIHFRCSDAHFCHGAVVTRFMEPFCQIQEVGAVSRDGSAFSEN